MLVTVIQPYKLAEQMIGENYIELGNYLKLKAHFTILSQISMFCTNKFLHYKSESKNTKKRQEK